MFVLNKLGFVDVNKNVISCLNLMWNVSCVYDFNFNLIVKMFFFLWLVGCFNDYCLDKILDCGS